VDHILSSFVRDSMVLVSCSSLYFSQMNTATCISILIAHLTPSIDICWLYFWVTVLLKGDLLGKPYQAGTGKVLFVLLLFFITQKSTKSE
jgi:hypothetical protein